MTNGRRVVGLAFCLVVCALASPAWAQQLYDDHELEDRFYVTIGGFSRDDIRTTIQVNAKSPSGAVSAGAIIALESLFNVDENVQTGRIDGWYRFNRKSRINFTAWATDRDGQAVYEGEDDITIRDTTITAGDAIVTEDKTTFFAASYSYSFVNLEKFEAWFGGGLNTQKVNTQITIDLQDQGVQMFEEDAKATIPIPTLNFGMRYNFSPRFRILVFQDLFGLKIGDYSGKLNNTRLLAEWNFVKNFGIGAGFERRNIEADADGDDFSGSLDTSYTGLTAFLKAQF
jgi:opacity protein-like surface antigen